MATAIAPPPVRTEIEVLADLMLALRADRVVTFSGVTWDDYERLLELRAAADRRGPRIWYDRGSIELMSTGNIHETWKSILRALLERYAEEAGSRFVCCGSTTVARQELDRGFEPDECYYVQSVDRVLPLRPLDFATDPPPDLAIEIESSRTAIDKLGVYAAFGVPEVWRYNGEALTVLLLQKDRAYQPVPASLAFPNLPLAELVAHLKLAGTTDQGTLVRQFRDRVRATPTLLPTP